MSEGDNRMEQILQFYQFQLQAESQGVAVDWRTVANRMAVMVQQVVDKPQEPVIEG